jgi:hypothetical protein
MVQSRIIKGLAWTEKNFLAKKTRSWNTVSQRGLRPQPKKGRSVECEKNAPKIILLKLPSLKW